MIGLRRWYTTSMVALTADQAEELLQRHVAAFNAGVRTGDFSAFVDQFTDDAVMDFEGIPESGPFVGRVAIAERYLSDPPDDEILVKRWKIEGDKIVAEFYWSDIREAIGGCFSIVPRDRKIARLTIALGGPSCRLR